MYKLNNMLSLAGMKVSHLLKWALLQIYLNSGLQSLKTWLCLLLARDIKYAYIVREQSYRPDIFCIMWPVELLSRFPKIFCCYRIILAAFHPVLSYSGIVCLLIFCILLRLPHFCLLTAFYCWHPEIRHLCLIRSWWISSLWFIDLLTVREYATFLPEHLWKASELSLEPPG